MSFHHRRRRFPASIAQGRGALERTRQWIQSDRSAATAAAGQCHGPWMGRPSARTSAGDRTRSDQGARTNTKPKWFAELAGSARLTRRGVHQHHHLSPKTGARVLSKQEPQSKSDNAITATSAWGGGGGCDSQHDHNANRQHITHAVRTTRHSPHVHPAADQLVRSSDTMFELLVNDEDKFRATLSLVRKPLAEKSDATSHLTSFDFILED